MPRLTYAAVAVVLFVLVACSSSSSAPDRIYKDKAGRSCSVPPGKIEGTCSPPASTITACLAGQRSCFRVGYVGESILNCGGCCADDGSGSSEPTDKCSALVCTTNGDCVVDQATCRDGICTSG